MNSILVHARHHGDNFRLTETLRRALQLVLCWYRRHRERNSLAELDNRMLADIGLSPADRDTECAKAFWQS